MVAPLELGFLASHSGSSLRAIVGAIEAGTLNARARLVVSNNGDSPALTFAAQRFIPAKHISARTEGSPEAADLGIAQAMTAAGVGLIVLSGYLRKLGPETLARFGCRILNIHPALLPSHGGQGMYGDFVHAAVLEAGDTVSGATVHLVDAEYDQGPHLLQREVPVLAGDTVETLRARVMGIEPGLFIDALRQILIRGQVLPDPL